VSGFVYILKSLKNNTFYIGSTDDLQRRMEEHKSGKAKYTSNILPVTLVFQKIFSTLLLARRVERWLKRLKDKEVIEDIIKSGVIKHIFR